MGRFPRLCLPGRRARDGRGAVLVEFALLVPILLLLVFGIVDFGYMINRETMINNVSRDGAREATFGKTYAAVLADVRSDLTGYGIPDTAPATTIVIDCLRPDGTACNATPLTYDALVETGGSVIVRITYAHKWVTPLTSSLFGSQVTLTKQTKMRVE